ncbi:cellulose binding domain-containing protein [Sorangium sp. So ce1036]|nr:cellulose binding domain-containing protein [Sorangium cellulosum]
MAFLGLSAAACTAATGDEEEAGVLSGEVITTDGLSPDALSPGVPLSGALSLMTDWGTGYCATLNVTNPGATQATSWTVLIDLRESNVFTLWGAAYSQSGSVLTVTQSNGSAIPPGGSVSVGFCANATGSDYQPVIVQ